MRTVAIAGIVHQLRQRLAGARSDAELLDEEIADLDAAFKSFTIPS